MFESARPRILGALLDAVVLALKRENHVHAASWPRMADFARWVVAAEPRLPWPAGSFLDDVTAAIVWSPPNVSPTATNWPSW